MFRYQNHGYSQNNESGITGLETAIILIAFVVVSAVFAFTLLSAGIFAAGESSRAVHGGLKAAQQTLSIKSSVVAFKDAIDTTGDRVGDTESIATITFMLSNTMAGGGIDLTPPYQQHHTQGKLQEDEGANPVVIRFNTSEVSISNCAWTTSFVGGNDGDNMLEQDESAIITVWLVNYCYHPSVGNYYQLGGGEDDPFLDDADKLLQADDTFALQIMPAKGATLTLDRTLPSSLNSIINLN